MRGKVIISDRTEKWRQKLRKREEKREQFLFPDGLPDGSEFRAYAWAQRQLNSTKITKQTSARRPEKRN